MLFLRNSLVLQPGANNDARKVVPISNCTPAPLLVLLQMLKGSLPFSFGLVAMRAGIPAVCQFLQDDTF